MRVIKRQKNSKNCIICGLDNEMGVKAPFYEMEDETVVSLFKYQDIHQSYPGRVHGGLRHDVDRRISRRGRSRKNQYPQASEKAI